MGTGFVDEERDVFLNIRAYFDFAHVVVLDGDGREFEDVRVQGFVLSFVGVVLSSLLFLYALA